MFGRIKNGIKFVAKVVAVVVGLTQNGQSQQDYAKLKALQQTSIATLKKFPGIIVVSAGNQGKNLNSYPVFPSSFAADIPNLLVVASANTDNTLSEVSNYGRMVQVASKNNPESIAVACDQSWMQQVLFKIFSPMAFCMSSISGNPPHTSEAAASVGRLVAEMLSVNPSLTPTEVIHVLRNTGTPVTSRNEAQRDIRIVEQQKALNAAAERSHGCRAK